MAGRAGARLVLIALLLMPLGMRGCCESPGLRLGRFSGFMDLSFRLSIDIDLSIFADFDLDVSIGAWADLELLADLELNLDLDAVIFKRASVKEDIDRDGYEESVDLLAAIDREDEDDVRIFLAWKGDEYTQDEGRCYLAWVDGDTMRLASARCGGDESALLCSAPVDDLDRLSCESCDDRGDCRECDTGGEVDDCQPEPEPEPGPDGDGTSGPERDAGTPPEEDAGVEPDAGVDGSVGIDASVQIDLPACLKQLGKLLSVAQGCGLSVSVDETAVCESDTGEVGVCFTSYVTADAAGQNYCSVLQDQYLCGPVLDAGDSQLTPCERRLAELVAEATACGMNVDIDVQAVCSAGSGPVDTCYVPYDVARLAGQDVCAVLEQALVCGVLR